MQPPPICKHNARMMGSNQNFKPEAFKQPCTASKSGGGVGGWRSPPPKHLLIWRFQFITYLKHAPLTWRMRFIVYLKHAPSFDESGSSYIYNTPSALASPVHNISYTRPFIWQFRLRTYLKHAPSFGHSGSTYILNTPSHRRFQSIIYLKHAPWRLRFIMYFFLPVVLPSFLPCFLTSFLPSVLSPFLPFFLPSCVPSFLSFFLPSRIPGFFLSFLPSFLPNFLPPSLPSFLSFFLPSLFLLCFIF